MAETALQKIIRLNKDTVKDPNKIMPGQKIKTDDGEVTVKKGDTLSKIAKQVKPKSQVPKDSDVSAAIPKTTPSGQKPSSPEEMGMFMTKTPTQAPDVDLINRNLRQIAKDDETKAQRAKDQNVEAQRKINAQGNRNAPVGSMPGSAPKPSKVPEQPDKASSGPSVSTPKKPYTPSAALQNRAVGAKVAKLKFPDVPDTELGQAHKAEVKKTAIDIAKQAQARQQQNIAKAKEQEASQERAKQTRAAPPEAGPGSARPKAEPESMLSKIKKMIGVSEMNKAYTAGLKPSTAAARKAHWEKTSKMDTKNPAAYTPAPGDATAETKPSKYTKAYKQKFGEEVEMIAIDEEANSALAKKAKKSGVSLSTLRTVYKRGVAAWRTGHRPGTTPQQWGMARVNSYIMKGKGTYHGADKDLREASDKGATAVANFIDRRDKITHPAMEKPKKRVQTHDNPHGAIKLKNGVEIVMNPNRIGDYSAPTGYDPTTGTPNYSSGPGKGGIVAHYDQFFGDYIAEDNKPLTFSEWAHKYRLPATRERKAVKDAQGKIHWRNVPKGAK